MSLHLKKKKIPLKNFLLANDQVTNTAGVIRFYTVLASFFSALFH